MKRSQSIGVAVLLLGAGLACTAPEDRSVLPSPSPTVEAYRGEGGPERAPRAEDIADNLAVYSGQEVTLESEVKRLMPNGFFTLKDDDLLVLSPSGQPAEDQEVTVRGTVHTYSAPELKGRYAWFTSDERTDREYEDRVVLVAESILTADGREVVTDPSAEVPGGSGETGRP